MSTFSRTAPGSALLAGATHGGAGSPMDYLAGGFFQVGYVTPDLDAFLATANSQLGIDRFMVLRDAQVTHQSFHGSPSESTQDLAFGNAGMFQIEVIQPTGGANTYTEFLSEHPGGGLHHTGALVEDYATAFSALSTHFTAAQTGRAGGTLFAYFDTRATLGSYVEIIQLDEAFASVFESIRAQTF